MGWFDEQIRLRIEEDELRFSDAFADMAEVVMGKRAVRGDENREVQFRGALEDILRWFGARAGTVPDTIEDPDDQMEYLLRPTGIMRRSVALPKGWYRDAAGPMLCETVNGEIVAALPGRLGGYFYTDPRSG